MRQIKFSEKYEKDGTEITYKDEIDWWTKI